MLAQVQIARIEEIIQSYVADKEFMGSVLVAESGLIHLSKGYGLANIEWQIPNTPSTKFRLGSITKQFTAVAILLLEESGLLKISDAISKHMPDAPLAWANITIFNLLTHTHGIPNYVSLPEYASITMVAKTPLELIALFRDKPLNFEPGTNYEYNNSGYVLLGYLIEKLSGTAYQDFVVQNIFKPLGMHDSGYDSHKTIILRRAAGYTKDNNEFYNADYLDMSQPYAAGSLYSTSRDLLTWMEKLFDGKIISSLSLQKMIHPFKENYGFGLEIKQINNAKAIMHLGGINGFNAALIYCHETKLTVVVLSNLNTTGYVWDIGFMAQNIALKIIDIAHGNIVALPPEKTEIIISPEVLNKYVGTYYLKPMTNLVIFLENGHLMAQLTNQTKIRLFAESNTAFFGMIPDIQVDFSYNKKNEVSHLNLHQSGHDLTANKISPAIISSL